MLPSTVNIVFAKGAPPPPPTCPIKSSGCYKTGGIKVGFGELTPSEFDYFLPEDKCMNVNDCNCGGVSETVAEQTDPDDLSGACSCLAVSEYNANGKCCGDDVGDCGQISSGVLCSIDKTGSSASWISSSANTGDIRYVGCAGVEYLSDGSAWQVCDGTFTKWTVDGTEYICAVKGRESIIECCGDVSCKSTTDGKRLKTGESITADNKSFYCASDKTFTTDLDTKDKETCEKAGFVWTLTKCCSEDDDNTTTTYKSPYNYRYLVEKEFYNDPNGIGGCWNSMPIISVNLVNDTNDSVINYNGEFHGCAIGANNYNKDNDVLLTIADKFTQEQLITDDNYCSIDPVNANYCSYTEKWMPTIGLDKTHFSSAPIANATQKAECCAQDECWDGYSCVENQIANPLAQPVNGYRCINGNWTKSEIKFTPGGVYGFCPRDDQCLVDVFVNNKSTQCIDSGQYIGENYCENGNWTTRTKLLALKLLQIKSGNYLLFCDSKDNSLNELKYTVNSKLALTILMDEFKAEYFCILEQGNNVIIGTTINNDLAEVPQSSLKLFDITSCNNAMINDGEFNPCDSTNKVWYNMKLNSIIYSKTPIQIPKEQNILALFENLIGLEIKKIINAIKRLITAPPFDESYLKALKRFNKLYMVQQGTKTIMGSIDGNSFKNLVVEYNGFDTDICKYTDQFNDAKKDVGSGISCEKDGNNFFVLAQGSKLSNINPETIWPDLTSKLRIK